MPNPGVTTLATIRTQVRQRADLVNSQYITDAEANSYINGSIRELYGLLVQKFGNDYYTAGTPDNWFQFTTTSNAGYALPDGSNSYLLKDGATTAPAFFKLAGVDLQLTTSPNNWFTLLPYPNSNRNQYSFLNGAGFGWWTNLRYKLTGGYLELTPLPTSGQVIRVRYVPRFTDLSADGDSFDGINGWEELAVLDAAIKCRVKSEEDVSALMAQKAEALHRLESEAEARDQSAPAKVGDIYASQGVYPPGSGLHGGY